MDYRKSSLQAFSTTVQTVPQNGTVSFANQAVKTGCSIRFTPGSNAVELAAGGLYEVSVNAVINGTAAGTVILQLFKDGVARPCCQAQRTVAVGDLTTLAFTGLIQLNPSCCAVNNNATLTLVNTGEAVDINQVSITVVKLA